MGVFELKILIISFKAWAFFVNHKVKYLFIKANFQTKGSNSNATYTKSKIKTSGSYLNLKRFYSFLKKQT